MDDMIPSTLLNLVFRPIEQASNGSCPLQDASIVTIFRDRNTPDVTAVGAHVINFFVITVLLSLRIRDGWRILSIIWVLAVLNCIGVLNPAINRTIQLVIFMLLPMTISRSFNLEVDEPAEFHSPTPCRTVVEIPASKTDQEASRKAFPDRLAGLFGYGGTESKLITFFYHSAIQTGYVRAASMMIEIALNNEGYEAPLPLFFINFFSTTLSMIALTGMRNHGKGDLELCVAQTMVFVNCFVYGFLSAMSSTFLADFCFENHSAYSASMLMYRSIFGISLLIIACLYVLIHDEDDTLPMYDSFDQYLENLSDFQKGETKKSGDNLAFQRDSIAKGGDAIDTPVFLGNVPVYFE
uniref:Transmembrane protein n=1 Tax=Panagrellus redivivus TaxID=6233 RepID=A0A7E4UXN8_PANRE